MAFYPGNTLRVSFEIRNASGTLVSPTTVACTHILPNGSEDEVTATNDATGLYHVDIVNIETGNHRLNVVTTGTLGARGVGTWYVSPSNL